MFTAVVRISGAGRLADFRERVRWLMVREAEAEDYTEHHADGVLEYRFEPRRGIPFPAFAAASGDFPELRVEASWERDGVRGSAVIENGRVMRQEAAAGRAGVEVSVGENAELLLGVVMEEEDSGYRGYAVSSAQHAYFRWRAGRLEILDVESPDEALESLAFGFVEEWIWFDEEDAAVERARYAEYGYPVRGANLRSEKLAYLRKQEADRHCTLSAGEQAVRDALQKEWLKKA